MAMIEASMNEAENRPPSGLAGEKAPDQSSASAKDPVEKSHPRESRQNRYAQAFSQIVAVMMRDANFRNLRLTDLEWLVIPPVMAGQWRLAQLKPEQITKPPAGSPASNVTVPVAAALWATVSPEIDKRLSENLDKPLLLRPNEWVSGDIYWMVAIAGDPRSLPPFLAQLQQTEFKEKQVKLRSRDSDGKTLIKTLEEYI